MKILFLTYHGFNPASGITKKMLAQIEGLRQNGHEVHVCTYDTDEFGNHCRFVDDKIICNYGRGYLGSLRQRFGWDCVYDYCKRNQVELVYARSFMNASPMLISLFRRLREAGVRSVMEIPTYPYDKEFEALPLSYRPGLWLDKCFRHQLAAQNEAIVTFSDEEVIFGQRTIRISNGVDFDNIPLHKPKVNNRELHLIGVAEVHPWHGFDRLLEGMGRYHMNGDMELRPVVFHIVGNVDDPEMYGSHLAPGFAPIIQKYGIGKYVVFHGKQFGKNLDDIFNQCSFAVGSLARHRSGVYRLKTLKNREYATRGLPFIYSEEDSDFDGQPYVLKVPADESPIDIGTIVSFADNHQFRPEEIRATVKHISWKIQMGKVLESLNIQGKEL